MSPVSKAIMALHTPVSGVQREHMLVGSRASWLMAVGRKAMPLKGFVQNLPGTLYSSDVYCYSEYNSKIQ